jgi:hypothetical protein
MTPASVIVVISLTERGARAPVILLYFAMKKSCLMPDKKTGRIFFHVHNTAAQSGTPVHDIFTGCASSVSFTANQNGGKGEKATKTKGIRKGEP